MRTRRFNAVKTTEFNSFLGRNALTIILHLPENQSDAELGGTLSTLLKRLFFDSNAVLLQAPKKAKLHFAVIDFMPVYAAVSCSGAAGGWGAAGAPSTVIWP